jgi:hypothetical protein
MNRTIAIFLGALIALFQPTGSNAGEEHAVLVYVVMSNPGFGSKEELAELFKLEEQVASAIECAHAGEHDGNEVGGGEFTIYCYGPNGDKLFAAIEPVLSKSKFKKNVRVVVRYGKPGAKQIERRL